jgi:hypothetical protein
MNFETAKYEHSLLAKSFFRTTVSGGGSILAVDFRWCLKSFPLRGAPRGFEESLYVSLYGRSDLHLGSGPGRGNTNRHIHIGSPQNRAVPPGVGNFSDTSGNRLPKSTRLRKRLF